MSRLESPDGLEPFLRKLEKKSRRNERDAVHGFRRLLVERNRNTKRPVEIRPWNVVEVKIMSAVARTCTKRDDTSGACKYSSRRHFARRLPRGVENSLRNPLTGLTRNEITLEKRGRRVYRKPGHATCQLENETLRMRDSPEGRNL